MNTSVNTSQSAAPNSSQNNLLKKAKTNIPQIPLLNSQAAAASEPQDCAPEKRANPEVPSAAEDSLIKLQPI